MPHLCEDTIIGMSNDHLRNNSYAPSTTHFERSYNKGENKQDRSTSHAFLGVTLDEVNSSLLQKPFGIDELLQCVDKLIA
jgi:hypothetical protein